MIRISKDRNAGIIDMKMHGEKLNVAFEKNNGYSLRVMYPSSFGCTAGCLFCSSRKGFKKINQNYFLLLPTDILQMVEEVRKVTGNDPDYISNEGGGEPFFTDSKIAIKTINILQQRWPQADILISSIFPKGCLEEIGNDLIKIGIESAGKFIMQASIHSFTERREHIMRTPLNPIYVLGEFANDWRIKTGRKLMGNIVVTKATVEEIIRDGKPPINTDDWLMRLSPLNMRDKVLDISYLKKLSKILQGYGFEVWENIPTSSAVSIDAVPGLIN